jgi:homoserine O-acetyltransferase/O-succinyltransferase
MSLHDVGRERGGIGTALGRVTARVRVVAVSSDRLFPPHRQQELAQAITSGVTMTNLESLQGHDGFLTEQGKLDPILRQSLG